ncbi:beta-mannosidase [Olivibacter sp. SDN3]|uniref:glycoside hydrolase family 2 protein n=1 Tax=Olivibacter sp. SDN3 TaxID=2764720 RepID=UPI0016513CB9|nr:sugar-binding domain-containing protein [Olivibacter sp. SDN3]QNL47952.1 beta-mannosidase [Olivibacter sp. SDN3]
MKDILLNLLWIYCCAIVCAQPDKETHELWQPYRISPRAAAQQVDISGTWELAYTDRPIEAFDDLKDKQEAFATEVPNSVHWSLYKAGKLPHPYAHLNAQQYRWVEAKVWYYSKKVEMPKREQQMRAFLSFDGIDYFSRVWLNGELLGSHEGMFGGPVLEISDKLHWEGSNEIVVEVKAANWGKMGDNFTELNRTNSGEFDYSKFNGFNPRKSGKIVRPWVIGGGSGTEAFFVLGMWQQVRIDLVPPVHVERPYLTTEAIASDEATLQFACELFANKTSLDFSLHPWHNTQINHPDEKGNVLAPLQKNVQLTLNFLSHGQQVHSLSWESEVIEGKSWVEKQLKLPNPKLWYPNGLGEAHVYAVELLVEQDGKLIDQLNFDYGVRSIGRKRTTSVRTADNWEDWQFVVNNKPIFVKGMNWTPADLLLDLSEERYRWALQAMKDMGVQLVRVWGGGLLETETFYKLCNELGIMVWQDFPIGNQDTPDYPQDIWEAQVVQNIIRLRNHPSLVVWCGGNEFNPYSFGNAASIGILERNLTIFDPSRLFLRTSPDGGSAHVYPDMDPNWYKVSYRNEPWIAETGMHSMPEAKLFYELVDSNEFFGLGKMWEKDFAAKHPEFIHHFTEYGPARVPRMLSRASHFNNMQDPSIEEITEASQVGAGEWYQVMAEGVQANYPVTTGLMPWVFKRHWPVIAIQLMDWFGQAGAPYYFLKRTYEPTHVMLDLPRLLFKPGEQIRLSPKVLHGPYEAIPKANIRVTYMDDTFHELAVREQSLDIAEGTGVHELAMDSLAIADDYRDRFLFLIVELFDQNGKKISQSQYNLRVLAQLNDAALYRSYLEEPIPWITLEKGPWLKPRVAKSSTALSLVLLDQREEDGLMLISCKVKNEGKKPAFMTTVDIGGVKRVFVADDNYFWLAPGEERTLTLKINWRESVKGKQAIITVDAWNAKRQVIKLE